MKKLSILIPTLGERKHMLDDLIWDLIKQGGDADDIEILTDRSETESIGAKRNMLLYIAKGDYVASIDDDDKVSKNYIPLLLSGIATQPTHCSLNGIITWDGLNPEWFEHSIKYTEYKTNELAKSGEIKYERYPNHLNCIRADIAKQFKFPETNHGEDTDWATQIFKSGLLKTEYYIEQVLYYYQFRPKK